MIRVGIVGSGFGFVGLLPAFASIPHCKVVALCTKDPKKLPGQAKIKGMRIHADWKSLLEDDIDAVAIATPPAIQYEIAKAAIAKGLHVFAEKPLAASLAQARHLHALAKKKKIVHGIDFMFPEIEAWRKVKDILDAKTFGTLQHVSVDWEWLSGDIRYNRRSWRSDLRAGGGALSFYFSHGLQYLEHFAGEINSVKILFAHSPKSHNGGEVGFDMLLRWKSGATGHVHLSSNVPGPARHRLAFACERGTIVLENKDAVVDGFVVRTYTNDGERIVKVQKERSKKGEDERAKIVRKLAKRFVDACDQGTKMTPSFEDGVRVQWLIEKIRASTM